MQKEDDIQFEESQDHSGKENVEALINSYKRSVELKPSQRNILEGSPIRKRSPYGLVYNQGKPIGILEVNHFVICGYLAQNQALMIFSQYLKLSNIPHTHQEILLIATACINRNGFP